MILLLSILELYNFNFWAPFGNAVGARLGQVSQVRVGLRFVKPGCGSNLASRFEALADTLTPNPTLALNASGWFLFLLVGDPPRILSMPLPLHPSLHQWPPPPSLHHIKKRTKGWDSKSTAPRSPESGSSALPTTRDNFALSSSVMS